MSFSDDMRVMTPEEVKQAVIDRLVRHNGIPHDAARGEPVWALLLSSFPHWREDTAKLGAVDQALSECVPKAFDEQNWDIVRDACDFIVALVDQPNGWLPPSSRQWPYDPWLQAPIQPPAKVDAAIAALHLMRHAKRIDKFWMNSVFESACKAMTADATPVQASWLIECWKVEVALSEGNRERGLTIPLFNMFKAAGKSEDTRERERLVRAAVSWAWLLFKPRERVRLAAAVRKVIEDFNDWGFIEIMVRVEKEEFPENENPIAWQEDVRTSVHVLPEQQQRPMDRLRTPPDETGAPTAHRMSNSWQQLCPA